VAIVIFGVLASQTAVLAQGVNRSVSSGMFGPRTLGSGITPGTRSFGREAFSSGSTMTGPRTGVGPMRSVSPAFDQRPGQFVGADSRDVREVMDALGFDRNVDRGSSSGPSQRGRNRPGGANRRGSDGRSGGDRENVRSSVHVAFDYPRTMSGQVGAALARRLERSVRIRTLSAMEVRVRDGTATLRGVVATQHDRDLAERLARLEAGIWHVNNELVVAQGPGELGPFVPEEPAAGDAPAADRQAEPTESATGEPAADISRELVVPPNLTLQPAGRGSSGSE
jgi:hypothetical protein